MSDDKTVPELPKETLAEVSEKTSPVAQNSAAKAANDSFNVPVKKSPLLMYALLQIPLVLFMVALLYFMYQAKQD